MLGSKAVMPYAVSTSAGTLIWAAILGCFITSGCVQAAPVDESPLAQPKTSDGEDAVAASLDLDSSMSKRDWNRNLHSWGKRAWQNLQGGWGKRGASYPLYYPYADKRAWQKLQGGWGKRFAAPEDDLAIKQLAALIEDHEERLNSPYDNEYGFVQRENPGDLLDEGEKRAWKGLNSGWGKRSENNNNWSNFRGSWGKRDPAWTNLKGIWGKRNINDNDYPSDVRIAQ